MAVVVVRNRDDDDVYNGDAVYVNRDRRGVDPTGPFQQHSKKELDAMYREDKKRKRCGDAAAPVADRNRGSATAKGPSKGEIGGAIQVCLLQQLVGHPRLVGTNTAGQTSSELFEPYGLGGFDVYQRNISF